MNTSIITNGATIAFRQSPTMAVEINFAEYFDSGNIRTMADQNLTSFVD